MKENNNNTKEKKSWFTNKRTLKCLAFFIKDGSCGVWLHDQQLFEFECYNTCIFQWDVLLPVIPSPQVHLCRCTAEFSKRPLSIEELQALYEKKHKLCSSSHIWYLFIWKWQLLAFYKYIYVHLGRGWRQPWHIWLQKLKPQYSNTTNLHHGIYKFFFVPKHAGLVFLQKGTVKSRQLHKQRVGVRHCSQESF